LPKLGQEPLPQARVGKRGGAQVLLEGLAAPLEDVPQGNPAPPRAGLPQRTAGLLLDRSQLGQGERDGPLVPVVQLQPLGKLRGNLGHDLPLRLGELDGDVLWYCGHRVTPGP
jgi:hypothetical protein